MRTPDVNVLLYAINGDSTQHDTARTWIEASFARPAGVGFAWPALIGFLRLATRSGIFARPLTVEDALSVIDTWLDHPRAHVLAPTARHAAVLAGRARWEPGLRCALGRHRHRTRCRTRHVRPRLPALCGFACRAVEVARPFGLQAERRSPAIRERAGARSARAHPDTTRTGARCGSGSESKRSKPQ